MKNGAISTMTKLTPEVKADCFDGFAKASMTLQFFLHLQLPSLSCCKRGIQHELRGSEEIEFGNF